MIFCIYVSFYPLVQFVELEDGFCSSATLQPNSFVMLITLKNVTRCRQKTYICQNFYNCI